MRHNSRSLLLGDKTPLPISQRRVARRRRTAAQTVGSIVGPLEEATQREDRPLDGCAQIAVCIVEPDEEKRRKNIAGADIIACDARDCETVAKRRLDASRLVSVATKLRGARLDTRCNDDVARIRVLMQILERRQTFFFTRHRQSGNLTEKEQKFWRCLQSIFWFLPQFECIWR